VGPRECWKERKRNVPAVRPPILDPVPREASTLAGGVGENRKKKRRDLSGRGGKTACAERSSTAIQGTGHEGRRKDAHFFRGKSRFLREGLSRRRWAGWGGSYLRKTVHSYGEKGAYCCAGGDQNKNNAEDHTLLEKEGNTMNCLKGGRRQQKRGHISRGDP